MHDQQISLGRTGLEVKCELCGCWLAKVSDLRAHLLNIHRMRDRKEVDSLASRAYDNRAAHLETWLTSGASSEQSTPQAKP